MQVTVTYIRGNCRPPLNIMSEQLKRTFHGCLTCRKRKVRCHGGTPCQNCSRMNITCHSSFDTNLRIRVSTPNGQKVVDTKPAPNREPAEKPQHQHPLSTSPPYVGYAVHSVPSAPSDPYATSFQPQFNSFSFAQPTTSFAPEPPTLHFAPPTTLSGAIPGIDAGQFNPGIWNPFDFNTIDSPLGRDFLPRVDVGLTVPTILPPMFDTFLPPTPASQPYSISDSEGSTSSQSQNREAPKEWVPRRRKRIRKDETAESASQQQEMVGQKEMYNHLHSAQGGLDQDARWSFNRFVADFVGKRSPHCPMRLAVLAWTAKRTSEKGAFDPAVGIWYSQASDQVEKLINMPEPTLQLSATPPVANIAEVIIATSFFLNRYDVLNGNLKVASGRLERMTGWLARNCSLNLSAFASKLLLWACYLQIRISIFNNEYLHSPSLLDVLSGRGDYHYILERSHNFHLDMFSNDYPQDRLAEDVKSKPPALHLHETFRLLNSILRYRALSLNPNTDLTDWEELCALKRTVEDELQRVSTDFDLAVSINPSAEILRQGPMLGTGPTSRSFPSSSPEPTTHVVLQTPPTPPPSSHGSKKLSRVALHWLTAYAAFNTTKILWSRFIRQDIRTDETSTSAVESILQIALILRRSEGRNLHARELPSMLWPLPLFVAGIEAVDEVWADWVRGFMEGLEGEGAGKERGEKGRLVELMDDVRRRQEEEGRRVYVTGVLEGRGEGVGMFVF